MESTAKEYLAQNSLLHIGMTEAIARGTANIIYAEADGVLIKELKSGAYMISVPHIDKGKELMRGIEECSLILVHQEFMLNYIKEKFGLTQILECFQSVYRKKERGAIKNSLEIKKIGQEQANTILRFYDKLSEEEVHEIIKEGALFGGYKNGVLIGFIGIHLEGSIGILEVLPEYRRCGYGEELESYMVNVMLDKGRVPFGQVLEDNTRSIELQKKLGFQLSEEKVYWLF